MHFKWVFSTKILCAFHVSITFFSNRIPLHVITPTTWLNLVHYDVNLLFTSPRSSNISSFATRITHTLTGHCLTLWTIYVSLALITLHPLHNHQRWGLCTCGRHKYSENTVTWRFGTRLRMTMRRAMSNVSKIRGYCASVDIAGSHFTDELYQAV